MQLSSFPPQANLYCPNKVSTVLPEILRGEMKWWGWCSKTSSHRAWNPNTSILRKSHAERERERPEGRMLDSCTLHQYTCILVFYFAKLKYFFCWLSDKFRSGSVCKRMREKYGTWVFKTEYLYVHVNAHVLTCSQCTKTNHLAGGCLTSQILIFSIILGMIPVGTQQPSFKQHVAASQVVYWRSGGGVFWVM